MRPVSTSLPPTLTSTTAHEMIRTPHRIPRLKPQQRLQKRSNSTPAKPPPPPPSTSSSTLLRQLMRSVAQPVAVITVPLSSSKGKEKQLSDPHDHGATLSSLSSISLSPPLVAFSLRLPSRLATYLIPPPSTPPSTPPKLRVHLLSGSQEAVARAFARQAPLPAPAAPSPPPSSPTPSEPFPPTLFQELESDSLGHLDCVIVSSTDLPQFGGEETKGDGPKSHLFIAKVEEAKVRSTEEGERGSLVYWEQGYHTVGP